MTDPAPLSHDFIGPDYFSDPYYKSDAYREKLAAAEAMEAARQALLRGEATPTTLACARFLSAVENDATLSHGAFKKFAPDDKEVVRKWPHLTASIRAEKGDE